MIIVNHSGRKNYTLNYWLLLLVKYRQLLPILTWTNVLFFHNIEKSHPAHALSTASYLAHKGGACRATVRAQITMQRNTRGTQLKSVNDITSAACHRSTQRKASEFPGMPRAGLKYGKETKHNCVIIASSVLPQSLILNEIIIQLSLFFGKIIITS